MSDDTSTAEPAAWEPANERKITWAGEISINAERNEAILTITLFTEEKHFLRIPRGKLEALGNDLDWARHRLAPWPERSSPERSSPGPFTAAGRAPDAKGE